MSYDRLTPPEGITQSSHDFDGVLHGTSPKVELSVTPVDMAIHFLPGQRLAGPGESPVPPDTESPINSTGLLINNAIIDGLEAKPTLLSSDVILQPASHERGRHRGQAPKSLVKVIGRSATELQARFDAWQITRRSGATTEPIAVSLYHDHGYQYRSEQPPIASKPAKKMPAHRK